MSKILVFGCWLIAAPIVFAGIVLNAVCNFFEGDEYKKLVLLAIVVTVAMFVMSLAAGYFAYFEVGRQIELEVVK